MDFESLSKTTKLILLDSLLQEVCISSGLDGSLTLEFARVECLSLSVTNLLYSGLKKAHLTGIKQPRNNHLKKKFTFEYQFPKVLYQVIEKFPVKWVVISSIIVQSRANYKK